MEAGLPDNLGIDRVSTVDQVAERLRQMIWSGELAPQLRLREIPLAQSFGVSRNTIRDAIRLLTNQGLIRHELHRGAVVAELTPEDIVDLYHVRRIVELAAVMERDPPAASIEAIKSTVETMEQAATAGDWQTLTEFDMRFHLAIGGLLDSERIGRFFDQIGSEFRLAVGILTYEDDRAAGQAHSSAIYEEFAEYEDPLQIAAEHRAIYEEIAGGQHRKAQKLLKDHLQRNENRLLDIVRSREASGVPG